MRWGIFLEERGRGGLEALCSCLNFFLSFSLFCLSSVSMSCYGSCRSIAIAVTTATASFTKDLLFRYNSSLGTG